MTAAPKPLPEVFERAIARRGSLAPLGKKLRRAARRGGPDAVRRLGECVARECAWAADVLAGAKHDDEVKR